MVYTQVEGGAHNQATWGFILPYFLRWTFPTTHYLKQHPFDGSGFSIVPMKSKTVARKAAAARQKNVQATRLLRVAAVKSKIQNRRSRT